MDTTEIDVLVSKNQIAFDFDSLIPDEEMEETSSLIESEPTEEEIKQLQENVLFVAVDVPSNEFFADLNKLRFCGKSALDWLVMANAGCQTKIIQNQDDILPTLKSINTDKEYIAVFYSDTPLITKGLFAKIMGYFIHNHLNGMSLTRGYVFRTSYLAQISTFLSGPVNRFNDKAFLQLNSARAFKEISNSLQSRIIQYHINGGVKILDAKKTSIDADVFIESGVVIYPNNAIICGSVIEEGVTLFEGNKISKSVVGKGSTLSYCTLFGSKVNGKNLTCRVLNGEEI